MKLNKGKFFLAFNHRLFMPCQWFSNGVPRLAASVSPENLLEMLLFRHHPRPNASEIAEVEPSKQRFSKFSSSDAY